MAAHVEISLEDVEYPTELCEVCYLDQPSSEFYEFSTCHHRFCITCVRRVFHNCINSSSTVQCLRCEVDASPEEVKSLMNNHLYDNYLNFKLRKYLSTVPDVRYCLAPDCPFACIVNKDPKNPADSNHFICMRDECRKEYCNECKLTWHPGQSCTEAKASAPESEVIPEATLKQMNAKPCPTCKVVIEKMEDGTCNEVKCAVCHTTFCWLCMKPVSEMHFLSPTGCPMYGRQRWNRRKRYCCRLWLWLLAPLGTLLISILLVPIIIVCLPILVGYLVYSQSNCSRKRSKPCRVFITIISIVISLLLAPLVGLLCGLVMIPICLFYAYCFVPVHICMQSS